MIILRIIKVNEAKTNILGCPADLLRERPFARRGDCFVDFLGAGDNSRYFGGRF